MSRLWIVASIAAVTLLTVGLCAEKGPFKDRLYVAGYAALALELLAWIFV